MSRSNGLSKIGARAGAPQRQSVVGDAISSDLLRLQSEHGRAGGIDEVVEALLPAVYEGVRRGIVVSLSSAPQSGVVRLRFYDAGTPYEWYAADAEWATVLGEAIAEVLRKLDA